VGSSNRNATLANAPTTPNRRRLRGTIATTNSSEIRPRGVVGAAIGQSAICEMLHELRSGMAMRAHAPGTIYYSSLSGPAGA
jgi:hypothetical protein